MRRLRSPLMFFFFPPTPSNSVALMLARRGGRIKQQACRRSHWLTDLCCHGCFFLPPIPDHRWPWLPWRWQPAQHRQSSAATAGSGGKHAGNTSMRRALPVTLCRSGGKQQSGNAALSPSFFPSFLLLPTKIPLRRNKLLLLFLVKM